MTEEYKCMNDEPNVNAMRSQNVENLVMAIQVELAAILDSGDLSNDLFFRTAECIDKLNDFNESMVTPLKRACT